jgi:hypothetical protein
MNIWIAVVVAAVLLAILLIAIGSRRARTEGLRHHFGDEYDRTSEHDLIARVEEVKTFDIRPLTAQEAERFRDEWRRIEARFVEGPAGAVLAADEVIANVMMTRGYPMADFNKHVAHLSVKHPRVIEHYRAGHDMIEKHERGAASTEDLRQAMLHYRALFEDLVNDRGDIAQEIPTARETAPRPIVRQPASDEYPRDEVRK